MFLPKLSHILFLILFFSSISSVGNIFFILSSALLSNLDRGPIILRILEPKADAKSIPIKRHIIIHIARKKASII